MRLAFSMQRVFVIACLLLAALPKLAIAGCTTDIDCSLNGVCAAGACLCDKPWNGPSCGVLLYKVDQPVLGKNLYPHNDTDAPKTGPCVTASAVCNALDTWNGPIVGPVDGKYHMYNPLYKKGSLLSTIDMMHGVATSIEGPYTWSSMGNMGSNPAFVTYNDSMGKTKYTLWVGGKIYAADSPDGPFQQAPGSFPGVNPAPLYHNGAFYMTNQQTRAPWAMDKVLTATTPGGPWTKFADISPHLDSGTQEDPFMWIDRRGNWHIINHAYDVSQISHCGNSTLSAHVFSEDGKMWHMIKPNVEPYSHTVHYADGVSHTYTTLERPNCHFNAQGTMTHIALAADLMTQDAGCADYAECRAKRGGQCACTNCKYADHAGTIIIGLESDTTLMV